MGADFTVILANRRPLLIDLSTRGLLLYLKLETRAWNPFYMYTYFCEIIESRVCAPDHSEGPRIYEALPTSLVSLFQETWQVSAR